MQLEMEMEMGLGEGEDPRFLSQQLITYLGNKRSLLKEIETVVLGVRKALGGRRLKTCDAFSGSGVVSRMLKHHSDSIVANDFEPYATVSARAHLSNASEVDLKRVSEAVERINGLVESGKGPSGFIQEMYAPQDDDNIQQGERVFYTQDNAKRLDAYAQLIRKEDPDLHDLLLAPLLSAASIHANTAGVFKGFYKDKQTGLGRFGGAGADALSRILAPIRLEVPILSRFESHVTVYQRDAAELPDTMDDVDLVYLDPPYNQHPYGSNYFMLNLLVNYQRPTQVSDVSGIPPDWQRSDYNKRAKIGGALASLVERLPTRFIVMSFSDEGFLSPAELRELLESHGKTHVAEIPYNTYRASRNLSGRSLTVMEHLFVLDRG